MTAAETIEQLIADVRDRYTAQQRKTLTAVLSTDVAIDVDAYDRACAGLRAEFEQFLDDLRAALFALERGDSAPLQLLTHTGAVPAAPGSEWQRL